MTYVFGLVWVLSLVTFINTRFTSISVLLLSSLVYSSPVFWTETLNLNPSYIWSFVLCMNVVVQLYISANMRYTEFNIQFKNHKDAFLNRFFNASSISIFLIVIFLSGGIDVFFQGKYGDLPGGSLLLYYSWNSLLLMTCAYNLCTRKLSDVFNIISFFQIFLIFIGGDRTLPILYFIILITIYLKGRPPILFFTGPHSLLRLSIVLLIPILAISKSIYTYLPVYGFSTELINIFYSDQFWFYLKKDFEPNHSHQILMATTLGSVDYSIADLSVGIFSFLPGSSYFGINPHNFSLAVKDQYFTSWSDTAGIGAHYWAQAWVVGGIFGIILFFTLMIIVLEYLNKQINYPSIKAWHAISYTLIAIIAFYGQRNSMEQILSFVGRYLTIFIVIKFLGESMWSLLPRKTISQ